MVYKKKINYEQWWKDYEEINHLDPGTRVRKELISKNVQDSRYKSILDLGCGTGELLQYLKDKFPRKTLYGSDVSQNAIDVVKEKKLTKKNYIVDLEQQSKLPGVYDVIVCSEVIEHLVHWQNAIKLMKKNTTKKGARVIITTQAGKRYPHHLSIGHIQHFELEEINRVLEENSFKIVTSKRLGWPFMNVKNILVTHILKGGALKTGKISFIQKLGLQLFYYLYHITLGQHGPQIFIIAEKL